MTATPYGELIARLREATGADREINRELMRVQGYSWDGPDPDTWAPPVLHGVRLDVIARTKPYTSSLDAALTLVPEGWKIDALSERSDGIWLCRLWKTGHFVGTRPEPQAKSGRCPTPALALCIAALLARAALAGAQP